MERKKRSTHYWLRVVSNGDVKTGRETTYIRTQMKLFPTRFPFVCENGTIRCSYYYSYLFFCIIAFFFFANPPFKTWYCQRPSNRFSSFYPNKLKLWFRHVTCQCRVRVVPRRWWKITLYNFSTLKFTLFNWNFSRYIT